MSVRATVVIPTTGERGPLLELSLPTVLAQSVAELEVFIVGDGVGPGARDTIQRFVREDSRVRFFDFEKGRRRGERRRHHVLAEARGEIVCYLCDRDLMLADHVAVLERALADADFAYTLPIFIPHMSDELVFQHTDDYSDPADRATRSCSLPLSFVGHTLAMYRRLPHGWRAAPPGVATDAHMWRQFLAEPSCRVAFCPRPTILYFHRDPHPGLPVPERAQELTIWAERMRAPGWQAAFVEGARDLAIADRARLARSPLRAALKRWIGARSPETLSWLREHRSLSALGTWARGQLAPYSPRGALAAARLARTTMQSHVLRPHVEDFESAELVPGVRLEVCWVGERVGPGPRCAVFAFGDELMRLDCFEGEGAHMHLAMQQTNAATRGDIARLWFPPGSVADNIARGAFELEHNLAYAIAVNKDPRVRALRVPAERLAHAAAWMRERMEQMVAARGLSVSTRPRP